MQGESAKRTIAWEQEKIELRRQHDFDMGEQRRDIENQLIMTEEGREKQKISSQKNSLREAHKQGQLSDEELKASIGILKKKSIIELKNQKIFLDANEEEISKKIPEEIFIESLPVNYESLSKEQEEVFKSLIKRKDIVRVKEEKSINIQITKFGKEIVGLGAKSDLIEKLTPEILKKEYLWKNKK
ncbi:hypothetical protein LCGC14_2174390, partial [marine sediment metagenome]